MMPLASVLSTFVVIQSVATYKRTSNSFTQQTHKRFFQLTTQTAAGVYITDAYPVCLNHWVLRTLLLMTEVRSCPSCCSVDGQQDKKCNQQLLHPCWLRRKCTTASGRSLKHLPDEQVAGTRPHTSTHWLQTVEHTWFHSHWQNNNRDAYDIMRPNRQTQTHTEP